MQRELGTSAGRSVAVVGMGYWGKNLVRNFHELGALGVVCDANARALEMARQTYSEVKCCSQFESVLADPTVQAVAFATPAVMHYEMAKAAFLAGKDVFVEKPLATELAQGQELVELAAAKGRILMVGHILRYHPAVAAMQEIVASGGLGRIQYIYSNRLNIGKIRTEENILWSFAPHDISVILSLLNEMPTTAACQGGAYLTQHVSDVTLSEFEFPSGVRAHIFVSWLHPFKEQRLVIVGSSKMAVFDDTAEHKLVLYPHRVEWKNRAPVAVKAEGEFVDLEEKEPLKLECQQFLDSVQSRKAPLTDGREGLRVLEVLDACQRSLASGGGLVALASGVKPGPAAKFFVHESAYVDEGAGIGPGSKIWHFSHVMKGARLGEKCVIGQNVNIDGGTVIGNNVKIQNNVSVYTGITIEDDAFLGPSCVFTNVSNPRSQVNRHSLYEKTLLKRGCTIGANSTTVCGVTIGRYAFVAAGAVVTKNVADYALVMGNPARQVGWMSRHGHRLGPPDPAGLMTCPETGFRYQEASPGVLKCLDLPEDSSLPSALQKGERSYRDFKTQEGK
jgi:UDP-2-acetamido-3-amino-2,3-dideoxy-glucuronate N-acetyltransferase